MLFGFARAKVAPFDRVVKQTIHAVAVVLIILGGVNAALRGDGVRAARAVLIAKCFHAIAQFGQGGGGRCTRQPCADDDDFVLALVRRIDQLGFLFVFAPLLPDSAGRDIGIER